MSTKLRFVLALSILTVAACGESATGDVSAATGRIMVTSLGTSGGPHVTATSNTVTGEIVVPETAVTGLLVVRVLDATRFGYQGTGVRFGLQVNSANTSIAYWDGTAAGRFTGKVIGLKSGQTSLVFTIIVEESGEPVFRSAPVPVLVRLAS